MGIISQPQYDVFNSSEPVALQQSACVSRVSRRRPEAPAPAQVL